MKSMNTMKHWACAALAAAAFASGAASTVAAGAAAPAVAAEARVQVTFQHPQNFSEEREFGQQDRWLHKDYLETLKNYLVRRATPMLAPGQRLQVTITDIKLAGAYEPWRGPEWGYVRMMRDMYPPRIDLSFVLTDGTGKVLREGTRKLRDLSYLSSGASMPGDTDSLRYDKALLDRWLRGGPLHL
ncbi:MAG: DUF3016 domain-containing protein [Pseudomonadota bacterium]|jgi:hypothetical protein|nr:DUF3016 domain-containing protein [Xanthomonadaceae bacterium]MDE2246992.1 DUF3016 domain-containing protein [Xanthomonadaceae bacterium]MDE3211387.1 DUF3016 domain-containing protein [Pseudomonadota bacterium]